MIKSSNYQTIWVYCEEFPGREVPLVLLADGKPGYVINQWIYYLLEEEITPASLEMYVRALCHLYDFVMVRYPTPFDPKQTEGLLADFIDAKKFGTDSHCIRSDDRYSWLLSLGLYWKPPTKRTNTIVQYLNAINKFDDWQVTFHNSVSLNPYDERLMSAWEIYQDFQQRKDWDPFIHLHATQQHTKRDYQTSVYGKYSHKRHNVEQNRRKCPKAFPLEKFTELVQTSKNSRDKLIWLLMGAGSLRNSETLHLFLSDVQNIGMKHGDSRVVLADPEYGYISYTDENNQWQKEIREEYINRYYQNSHFSLNHPLRNLQPRTKYGKRNSGLHAGFKGMTFGDSDSLERIFSKSYNNSADGEHYMFWRDYRLGQDFDKILDEYLNKYYWSNPFSELKNPKGWPWHPWLFICTNKRNYGMPFTIPGLKQAWKRALKRIGMENSGLGMHSLRHMYGYYCANKLKLSIEEVQVLMHHASIKSTGVYYSLESSVIRETISKAVEMDDRISNEWGALISKVG